MSSPSIENTRRVLEAALTLFARHGYRRTSMADVAEEAGVARATLYLRFRDKGALFEALADNLVTDVLAAAEAAWDDGRDLAANLEAAILAKDLPLHRMLHATPHGAELMALDADLTRAHAQRLEGGFAALIARRAAEAERAGADLRSFDGPDGFAAFIGVTAAGLKHEVPDEQAYRLALRRLCGVAARATR